MDHMQRTVEIFRTEGASALLKRIINYGIKYFYQVICSPIVIYRITNYADIDIDNLFENIASGKLFFIRTSQRKSEILELLRIMKELKPRVLLEIGTALGGTLYLFSKAASEDALIMSVDLPGGSFGGGYPFWKIPVYKYFGSRDQQVRLIRKDSHRLETVDKVKGILKGRMLDFLFIDGDHTYPGIKQDFELYSGLVRRDGIIAFHDIISPPGSNYGINQFWNEIKDSYRHLELVEDKNQKEYGIGIIWV